MAEQLSSSPVALITGGAVRVGRAITVALARAGYRVWIHYHSSAGPAAALAAELGERCVGAVAADLADGAARDSLCARVLDAGGPAGGRLDLLVNNAGISRVVPHGNLQAATPRIWQELHEVNVIAPFRLIAEAQGALEAAAGCVVNVSSHAGVRPKGASIPYAASKAALNHMTRLLALSLAPRIRVNAVAPGLVDTPLTADWTAAQQLWRERAPMRRAAQPEDVAQAVALLAASNYMTGEILLLDGGLNLT